MRLGGAVRLGRYAVRAGASVQRQPGPPPRFGILGTLMCLILFAAIVRLWPLQCLIGLGVTVFVAMPLACGLGKAKLARQRKPERDPLDELVARWDREGRR